MSLARSKAIVELGKRLVEQLDDNDLLGEWMAHYIAERIRSAANSPDSDKPVAEETCAAAILQLWKHRHSFPPHLRPFGELEPAIRTLASLDVDETDYRFYPRALREAATAEADEAVKSWLELATGLDYSARLLIRFALRQAAQRAANEAEPWVELARSAGEDGSVEIQLVRFILESDGSAEGERDVDQEKADLQDKISKLERFAALATELARELAATVEGQDEKCTTKPETRS